MPDEKEPKREPTAEAPAPARSPDEDEPRTPPGGTTTGGARGARVEHDEDEEEGRGRFFRFTKKLMDRKELSEDAWKVMGSVIATSDKAKSDFIRMLGREVRHYLDGLQLTEDLRDLVTSHSLEVRASFSLKPLPREDEGAEPAPRRPAPADDEDVGE